MVKSTANSISSYHLKPLFYPWKQKKKRRTAYLYTGPEMSLLW